MVIVVFIVRRLPGNISDQGWKSGRGSAMLRMQKWEKTYRVLRNLQDQSVRHKQGIRILHRMWQIDDL